MTWDAYHRRKTALQQILSLADASAEVTAATALAQVDPAGDAYADVEALMFDVQMFWSAQLSAQLEMVVGPGAETPELAVISAWTAAAAVAPGARRLLDAAAHAPALAKAFAKEDELLARAAGVPVMSPDLLARGREIGESAREQAVLPEIAPEADEPVSLIGWLRSQLAA